jgi:hypothetical protein
MLFNSIRNLIMLSSSALVFSESCGTRAGASLLGSLSTMISKSISFAVSVDMSFSKQKEYLSKFTKALELRRHWRGGNENALSNCVCGKNIVSLTIPFAVEQDFAIWVFDFVCNVESSSGLDLEKVREILDTDLGPRYR